MKEISNERILIEHRRQQRRLVALFSVTWMLIIRAVIALSYPSSVNLIGFFTAGAIAVAFGGLWLTANDGHRRAQRLIDRIMPVNEDADWFWESDVDSADVGDVIR